MADITLPTRDVLTYLNALQISVAANRQFAAYPTWYILRKFGRKFTTELAEYEKHRVELCEKMAEKDDNGDVKRLPNGAYDVADMVAFQAALAPLLDAPVTISGVRKITPEELGAVELTDVEFRGYEVVMDDPDSDGAQRAG